MAFTPPPLWLASMLFRLLLGGLALFALWYATGKFPTSIDERVEEYSGKRIRLNEPASGLLFKELLCKGLIRVDLETMQIELPPEDLNLRIKAADPSVSHWLHSARQSGLLNSTGTQLTDHARELVAALHSRRVKASPAIHQQVALWNSHFTLAAIRDDRYDLKPTKNDDQFHLFGPGKNDWTAEIVNHNGTVIEDALVHKGLSHYQFGFMGWGESAPGGEWINTGITSFNLDRSSQDILFRTLFLSDVTRAYVVDVIGDLPVVSGAEVIRVAALCETYQKADGQFQRKKTATCGPGQTPHGYRLRIAPYSKNSAVTIKVRARDHFPTQIEKFTKANFIPAPTKGCPGFTGIKPFGNSPIEVTERIALVCRDSGRPECTLDWIDAYRPPPPRDGGSGTEFGILYRILSADDQSLTDKSGSGRPSHLAAELGLIPLIGLGAEDFYSLTEDLSGRDDLFPPQALSEATIKSIPTISLTIDSTLQKMAEDVLKGMPRPKNKNSIASLILIDASKDSSRGQILAAATFPQRELSSSTAWNILGVDAWRPELSPLVARAWSKTNRHTMPGSTFKVITALALIREAVAETADLGRKKQLLDAIKGIEEPQHYNAAPGLQLPVGIEITKDGIKFPHNSKPIGNFDKADHTAGSVSPSRSGCPALNGIPSSTTPQYGMCEALAKSVNTWFMATALALDKDLLDFQGHDLSELPPSRLVTMADRLLSPYAVDLAQLTPADSSYQSTFNPKRYWMDGTWMGSRELDPYSTPEFTVALNAIGQDVQTSPVALASMYASIASGCATKPWLAHPNRYGTANPCRPLFFDSTEDPSGRLEKQAIKLMEDYLVAGLHSVAYSSVGTARGHFRDDPKFGGQQGQTKRVYAKTGTAQTILSADKDSELNTAWLAGWIEPPPHASGILNRRIAFACMVTHTTGGGSKVCGPLIKALGHSLHDYSDQRPD